MLDYDKKFLIKSSDNLTFDGSSIRGFTANGEAISAGNRLVRFLLGAGRLLRERQVLVFGEVIDKDGSAYSADIRGVRRLMPRG
jgi:glutamine synthetase